jgi:hypothetical protein
MVSWIGDRLGVAAMAGLLLAGGCRRAAPRPPEDEIRAVFPHDDGAPLPLAERLCQALHEVPARARQRCCAGAAGTTVTSECVRSLSASLRTGAVTVGAVDGCERALATALAGCEWVGPTALELPGACQGLITGTRGRGQSCRSGLECRAGLFCKGAGPTDLGACAAPLEPGGLCDTSVDPLVAFTRQTPRQQCAGLCERHRCATARGVGEACRVDAQCGDGRCARDRCVAEPVGRAGAPCVPGGCESGLRCIDGTCATPASAGAACRSDQQCRGACRDGHCRSGC